MFDSDNMMSQASRGLNALMCVCAQTTWGFFFIALFHTHFETTKPSAVLSGMQTYTCMYVNTHTHNHTYTHRYANTYSLCYLMGVCSVCSVCSVHTPWVIFSVCSV